MQVEYPQTAHHQKHTQGTSDIDSRAPLKQHNLIRFDTAQRQSPRNWCVVVLFGRLGEHDRHSLKLPTCRQKTIAAKKLCCCHSPTALLRDHSLHLKACKHISTASSSDAPRPVSRPEGAGKLSST
jgi:hypothetical protein